VQLRFYIAQNLDCFPQNLFKIMNLSTSEAFSTENMTDNSPAFQGWVLGAKSEKSRQGRQKFFRPCRDLEN
jgi:hypothetical protein